jgi:hypothetical protein
MRTCCGSPLDLKCEASAKPVVTQPPHHTTTTTTRDQSTVQLNTADTVTRRQPRPAASCGAQANDEDLQFLLHQQHRHARAPGGPARWRW